MQDATMMARAGNSRKSAGPHPARPAGPVAGRSAASGKTPITHSSEKIILAPEFGQVRAAVTRQNRCLRARFAAPRILSPPSPLGRAWTGPLTNSCVRTCAYEQSRTNMRAAFVRCALSKCSRRKCSMRSQNAGVSPAFFYLRSSIVAPMIGPGVSLRPDCTSTATRSILSPANSSLGIVQVCSAPDHSPTLTHRRTTFE